MGNAVKISVFSSGDEVGELVVESRQFFPRRFDGEIALHSFNPARCIGHLRLSMTVLDVASTECMAAAETLHLAADGRRPGYSTPDAFTIAHTLFTTKTCP